MIDENSIEAINELAKGVTVNYIKLIKNRNGYNWEIKQLSLDLKALEKLNNEMITKFGDQI